MIAQRKAAKKAAADARKLERREIATWTRLAPHGIRVGVDFGGVILDIRDSSPHDNSTALLPAMPQAIESIATMVELLSPQNVFIVSKAKTDMQPRILFWLDAKNFYARTGFLPGNIHFCRETRDKGPIVNRFHITHFVDDRLDVLQCMTSPPDGSLRKSYLLGTGHRYPIDNPRPTHCQAVGDWPTIVESIRNDVQANAMLMGT